MGLKQEHSWEWRKQAPKRTPVSFRLSPAVARVVTRVPRAIATDLARPVIGPDHTAAPRISIVGRVWIEGRRQVEAAVEVAPVVEVRPMEDVRPVERVTMYEAVSAAMEDGCPAKAAAMEGVACTKPTTAVDRNPAAPKSTAVKCRATTPETTRCAAASETTGGAAAAKAAARRSAMLNLGSQAVGCKFR